MVKCTWVYIAGSDIGCPGARCSEQVMLIDLALCMRVSCIFMLHLAWLVDFSQDLLLVRILYHALPVKSLFAG